MRYLPALFLSVATINLIAQAPPRRPAASYDAAQEATFEGTILEVTQVAAGTRRGGGTHILLKTPAGDTEIRLGPSRFLSRQGMTLAKGDKVSVVGAKTGAGKD
ncbi:MAG TPA: hypothetical protein VJ483_09675, partial [Holophagaceae bacterium]|nr:hypothetical protein [Holophagaceae bacterium]